uniref:Glycosyltransferase n=1 Tax=Araucaria cunninghamii TaxID=56994 RepID=A0A0D6QRE3_ARACU
MEEIEKQQQRKIHVVMFPWLAHGHITPYVELAKSLHTHGFRISFASTPLNIARLKQQLLQAQPVPEIDLVELPLPSVEGLPAGAESTGDVKRGGTIPLLIEALDRCDKPFEALLRRLSPDFIIHDGVQYWTPRVARSLGIPVIYFSVIGVASTYFTEGRERNNPTAEDLTVAPPGYPSPAVRRRLFEAQKCLLVHRKDPKLGISFMERLSICAEECLAIACNSCVELEGAFIEYWGKTTERPVLPVGISMPPLPPRPPGDRCLDWLDCQTARSVVLVSFGTECTPTREEMAALALGLEESLVPFLCILLGHDGGVALPEGYEDRTRGRGLVVTKWAPQLHILNHPSTGAFLTHCGWNSVTEGLRFGVPFVALPMQYEQGLNARLIAEVLKIGVEVKRNDEDGTIYKEEICRAVRAVMVEENGRQFRSNVAKFSKVLTANECQIRETNIRNFVSFLRGKAPNNENPL